MKTIDIHVHPAFYEPICNDAQLESRQRILDIHQNGIASITHIRNQMRCAGLDRLVLLPQDYSSLTTEGLVTNEEIKILIDQYPDMFIGFASVDPFAAGAEEQLVEAFEEYGLKGLKLNPSKQKYDPADPKLERLYKICERYRKPVLFHSGISWEPDTLAKYAHPLAFEKVALKHPKLKVCLGHFAWPWVREAVMLMLKYPNIYADTAALYFDNAREFYTQLLTRDIPKTWVERSLRHQIMFGSNNPRFEQIRMAHAISEIGLKEDTVELIMGGNAAAFLELEEGE